MKIIPFNDIKSKKFYLKVYDDDGKLVFKKATAHEPKTTFRSRLKVVQDECNKVVRKGVETEIKRN